MVWYVLLNPDQMDEIYYGHPSPQYDGQETTNDR